MGKKSKKGKPEKLKKKRRGESGEGEDSNPDIPYPGSDRTKARLARLLVLLCAIGVGLMVYTVHYIRFVAVQKQRAAAEQAAAEAASEPPAGEIFFLRPDGTYVYEDGSGPALPQGMTAQNPTEEEPSAEGEAEIPEDGEASEGSEAQGSEETSGEEQGSENT